MARQSGWQLAGSGPESYERHNVIAFMETSRDLVALAALRTGERVLDVACGTGVLARLAAKAVGPTGKVAGADLNEGMLTTARSGRSFRSNGTPATRPHFLSRTGASTSRSVNGAWNFFLIDLVGCAKLHVSWSREVDWFCGSGGH